MATRCSQAATKYKRKKYVSLECDLYDAMLDALYFYADKDHHIKFAAGRTPHITCMELDCGKMARWALRKQGAKHF